MKIKMFYLTYMMSNFGYESCRLMLQHYKCP